ncbi:hypothetical protein [Fodinicurvata fenggangensis]|uniref:hypothetical protein n=1 Tax=Fodinicurvata fenggangensis TaxID=1121830 RepID=UPI0012DEEDEF|nr:hypothetical protein [Fodinicurvata fenggangensis]
MADGLPEFVAGVSSGFADQSFQLWPNLNSWTSIWRGIDRQVVDFIEAGFGGELSVVLNS